MLKKCPCGGRFEKVEGTHKGVAYSAYRCGGCGEELMDLGQASNFLNEAQKAKTVTFSKWGQAIAVRIPSEMVKAFKIKVKETGKLIPEKDGFKIIPTPS